MINDYFCVQLRQSINALFPLESAEEVISLSSKEICPVPGVSSALLGVVNQRGKLLWVLELSDLLQIPLNIKTTQAPDKLTLLVLSDNKKLERQVGCVVSALKGIITLDLAQQSLSSNSLNWESFGINSISFNGEIYAVIDVQSILSNVCDLNYINKLVSKV